MTHPAPLRMLLFAPSGASAATRFRDWNARLATHQLGRDITVVPIERPGHGARWAETLVSDMPNLVSGLIDPVLDATDSAQFTLGGHSVGALIAYELAHELATRGLPEPSALIALGHNAPDRMHGRISMIGRSDAEALAFLTRLGGVPEAMLAEPEAAAALLLPSFRADSGLGDTYRYRDDRALLDMPIIAVHAADDPQTSRDGMLAWREHTRGPFYFHDIDGDHFSVYTPDVASTVLLRLRDDLADAHVLWSRV